jgi:hypothetical protein
MPAPGAGGVQTSLVGTVQSMMASRAQCVPPQARTHARLAIGRGHYHCKHEPCWYVVRKGSTASWVGDHSQTTLWQIDKPAIAKRGEITLLHDSRGKRSCARACFVTCSDRWRTTFSWRKQSLH